MDREEIKHFFTKLGHPQICPKCGMHNQSGLSLPDECRACKGTGKIKILSRGLPIVEIHESNK